ncbi:MAG TPA: hypothetical protein VHG91_05320 [Longimicrobium sp.]|nr:hypothetical protein [Longimicrobium sp.]
MIPPPAIRTLTCAALALVCAAGARTSTGRPAPRTVPGDTVLVMTTGDRIEVRLRSRVGTGLELCAAVGQGIRSGKSLFAQTAPERASMPTVVRFPASASAPECTRLREPESDSVWVSFAKQVRDPVGRVARLRVGEVALPVHILLHRRATFRWVSEGADSAAVAEPNRPVRGLGRPRNP